MEMIKDEPHIAEEHTGILGTHTPCVGINTYDRVTIHPLHIRPAGIYIYDLCVECYGSVCPNVVPLSPYTSLPQTLKN